MTVGSLTLQDLGGARRIPGSFRPYGVADYSGGLSGISDWLTVLIDKPESWYKRLNEIQNSLVISLAEITSFGRDAWDSLQGRVAQEIAAGNQSANITFPGYDFSVEDIPAQVKAITITGQEGWLFASARGHVPSSSQIDTAGTRAEMYGKAVSFAKTLDAELASRVEAESAQVKENLSKSELHSPGQVGAEVFVKELEQRAKDLGAGGLEFLKYLPLILLGVGGLVLLTYFRK